MAIGLNITNIWPNLLKSKTYPLDTGIVGNLCAHHQYPDNWQGPRGNRPIVSFAPLIIQQPTNLIRHWEREIRLLQSSLRSTNSLGGWPRTHPAVMRWMVAIVRAGWGQVEQVPSHSTHLFLGQRVLWVLTKSRNLSTSGRGRQFCTH